MSCAKYSYFDFIIWQQVYHNLYRVWCVYAQFQRKEREECQGVYLEEDNVPILETEKMKAEDKTKCVA